MRMTVSWIRHCNMGVNLVEKAQRNPLRCHCDTHSDNVAAHDALHVTGAVVNGEVLPRASVGG